MRLFFALWPPLEVAEQLAGVARAVAQQFGGKPTRQETLHLTLAFLGEVPDDRMSLLMQTARRNAGRGVEGRTYEAAPAGQARAVEPR